MKKLLVSILLIDCVHQRPIPPDPVAFFNSDQVKSDIVNCGEDAVQQQLIELAPILVERLLGHEDSQKVTNELEANFGSAVICAALRIHDDMMKAEDGGFQLITQQGDVDQLHTKILVYLSSKMHTMDAGR